MTDSKPTDYAVTLARSVFAAVPVVGGLLNEVIFDHRGRVKQRRFEEFVAGLEKDLGRVKDSAIDYEYLRSDEFGDLLETTIRRVIQTGTETKRGRFREVLVHQITAAKPLGYTELYLDLIGELSEKEIEILSAFRHAFLRPRRDDEPSEQPKQGPFRNAEHYALDVDTFRLALQHLLARGLLYDDGVNRWSTPAMEYFQVTDLGMAFLRFLEGSAA